MADVIAEEQPVDERYRETARRWIDENFALRWRPDRLEYSPLTFDERIAWERQLYTAGYAGFTWPKQFGGQGLTLVEQLIVNEELGWLGAPDSLNGIGKDMVGPLILAVGTEEQKTRYLRPMLAMEEIWCQGFSESEAGSDLASVRTKAVEQDGEWVITGRKMWTSFAQHAHYIVVLARTGDPQLRHGSLSMFIVPMHSRGVSVRPIDQIDGRANFSEVTFDDVRTPADAVLGGVNKGWAAAARVLEIERAINRMYRASLFENELRHLVRACKADEMLASVISRSTYLERIAAVYEGIEVLRRLVRRTVLSLVGGGAINGAGSLIKLHWSETHQRLTALARDLIAERTGSLNEVTRRTSERFNELYLRSRAETIQGGASAVQLSIIARHILRLPKART